MGVWAGAIGLQAGIPPVAGQKKSCTNEPLLHRHGLGAAAAGAACCPPHTTVAAFCCRAHATHP